MRLRIASTKRLVVLLLLLWGVHVGEATCTSHTAHWTNGPITGVYSSCRLLLLDLLLLLLGHGSDGSVASPYMIHGDMQGRGRGSSCSCSSRCRGGLGVTDPRTATAAGWEEQGGDRQGGEVLLRLL